MNVKYELPAFAVPAAQELARDLYGLDCTLKLLPGERDQNFQLQTTNGKEFVMKISNISEDRNVLDLQNSALEHIAQYAPELEIPRLCRTRTGESIAEIADPKGRRHFIRLLTFIPARLMANVQPHTLSLLRSLGSALGRLSSALQNFAHPAAGRKLKWDLTHALWVRDYLDAIETSEQRALVNRFLEIFEAQALPALSGLRRSVIYNDANDYNILVGSANRVIGFIDFGDMLHSITIGDLAVAVAYGMLGKSKPVDAASHIVAGYRMHFPISESEMMLLLPLACARLCITVVNAAYQRRAEPDNVYLTISETPAWYALRQLSTVRDMKISQEILDLSV